MKHYLLIIILFFSNQLLSQNLFDEKFYDPAKSKIHEFNLNYNFFDPIALSKTLKSGDIQKIWYIYNLSSWHLSRITK